MNVLGVEIPDEGPVFVGALAVHVAAGATAVVAGALAALAGKRRGRHPVAGRVFLVALAALTASAAVLAAIRWREDRHLAAIAVVAATLGAVGWWARRRRPQWRLVWHGLCMAGAYMALLTGFYVDNGPHLPLWNRLPQLAFWLLPTLVGAPLTWRALRHNHALRPRGPVVTPPR